jgi:hypothetical protein
MSGATPGYKEIPAMARFRGLIGRKDGGDRTRAEEIDSERIAARLDRIMQRDGDENEFRPGRPAASPTGSPNTDRIVEDRHGA